MEMNDLFKQLKYDINEAEQYKNGIEMKSKLIKNELLKHRIAHTLNKNILERNYNDNMNVNYDELITNKDIKTIDSNTNLQGVSEFQYFNTKDNLEKNGQNDINQLNENNKNGMSSLAMAGRNIIELTGENELIPINNNTNII